jgi:hypothetical protein
MTIQKISDSLHINRNLIHIEIIITMKKVIFDLILISLDN